MDKRIYAVEFEAKRQRALAKLPGALPDHIAQAQLLEEAATLLRLYIDGQTVTAQRS